MNPITILDLPDMPFSDKVAYLAYELKRRGDDLDLCPVWHSFQAPWYIREFILPPHMALISRVHAQGHIVKLIYGTVVWIRETDRLTISGSFTTHTKPGDQMVAFTLTECRVRSYHLNPDELTDVIELENEHYYPAEQTLLRGEQIAKERLKWSDSLLVA